MVFSAMYRIRKYLRMNLLLVTMGEKRSCTLLINNELILYSTIGGISGLSVKGISEKTSFIL